MKKKNNRKIFDIKKDHDDRKSRRVEIITLAHH